MHYPFPHIEHIDELRAALAGRTEFCFAEKDGYTVANYFVNLADTFPTPDTKDPAINRDYMLRREARGIIFCSTTGRVIARRYHKFFNLGERAECSTQAVDFSMPHVILEKLDGSMITPFYVGNLEDIAPEKMRWGTKMGETDVSKPVEAFIAAHPTYANYAAHCFYAGYTLIFEWCSRKQRIVIDYPKDRLVLTAVRHMKTGKYLPYSDIIKARTHGIEVVEAYPGNVSNVFEFLETVRSIKGAEGFVIRFDNGHMLKVKADEYVQIHRAKDLLNFEKDVWSLILSDKLDDLLPVLNLEDREPLAEFASKLTAAVLTKADELKREVIAWIDNNGGEQKRFATEFVNAPKSKFAANERGLLFKIKAGADPKTVVRDYVLSQCNNATNLDGVRNLVGGLRWEKTLLTE
jgi:RNA ligase